MRYQIIEEAREDYSVSVLCDTLDVSLSGYYAWKKRPLSEHLRADEVLADQIQEVYQSSRQVYGSPRIHAELQAQGITSSCKRVAPNLLDQNFTASHPNEKWTGDMSAVWTYEGWLYLAVVLDLFSRRVIS